MSLVILADSQVERVWRNVRLNRELLRTATYAPVKRLSQLHEGVKVLTAQVIVKRFSSWSVAVIDLFVTNFFSGILIFKPFT